MNIFICTNLFIHIVSYLIFGAEPSYKHVHDTLSTFGWVIPTVLFLNQYFICEDLRARNAELEKNYDEVLSLYYDKLSDAGFFAVGSIALFAALFPPSMFCIMFLFFIQNIANVEELVIVYKALPFPENKHFLLRFMGDKWIIDD